MPGEASLQEAIHNQLKSGDLPFRDFVELVLYHPKFGYYASGRVSFTVDYQTYPNVLAPYFGHMIAQQMFRMWRGMRQAGTS